MEFFVTMVTISLLYALIVNMGLVPDENQDADIESDTPAVRSDVFWYKLTYKKVRIEGTLPSLPDRVNAEWFLMRSIANPNWTTLWIISDFVSSTSECN